MLLFPPFKKHSPEVDKEMAMQDTTLTQDLLPAKKLTFVDATHELTQSVTEYERYFFPGTNNDNNKEKEEDVTLIKKAKKDPNAHSLRRYI